MLLLFLIKLILGDLAFPIPCKGVLINGFSLYVYMKYVWTTKCILIRNKRQETELDGSLIFLAPTAYVGYIGWSHLKVNLK